MNLAMPRTTLFFGWLAAPRDADQWKAKLLASVAIASQLSTTAALADNLEDTLTAGIPETGLNATVNSVTFMSAVTAGNLASLRQMVLDEWHYPDATVDGETVNVAGVYRVGSQAALDPGKLAAHQDFLETSPQALQVGDRVYEVDWTLTDSNQIAHRFTTLGYENSANEAKFEPLIFLSPSRLSPYIKISGNHMDGEVTFTVLKSRNRIAARGHGNLSCDCANKKCRASDRADGSALYDSKIAHTREQFEEDLNRCYCNSTFSFGFAYGFSSVTVNNDRSISVSGKLGWKGKAQQEVLKSCEEDTLLLDIKLKDGGMLELSWDSAQGQLYRIRSETDLAAGEPASWPVYNGNEDIVAALGRHVLSFPVPTDSQRYFVVESYPAPPSVVFTDDFESGQGAWTTDKHPGDTGPTEWELGSPDPNLTGGPPGASSGDNCFGTDLSGNYGEGTSITLRSPAIDLSDLAVAGGDAEVVYFRWIDIEEGSDFARVRLLGASDNGEIAILEDNIASSSGGWEEVRYRLPPESDGKSVILEFLLESDEFGNGAGFYIDDVVVQGPAVPPFGTN